MINYCDDAIRVSLNIKIRYLRSMGIIMNVLLQISILLYVLENNVENTEGERAEVSFYVDDGGEPRFNINCIFRPNILFVVKVGS